MIPFKAWLSAARLRTLPLSISGIIVGCSYAYAYQIENGLSFSVWIVVCALITTLGFQVLSNFANDYGDGVKGTDNDDRIGPVRALQSGAISPAAMKKAIITTSIISFIAAVTLIYVSLGTKAILVSFFFMALGIAAIWAAIKYTVGDNAYGYRGLGDVFVFIFFGPVSVLGVAYLITQQLDYTLVLPGITIGLLSVAVLNLNNMRDIHSDTIAGKNTIVVKMGFSKARIFHYLLLSSAFISNVVFLCLLFIDNSSLFTYLPLLAFIIIAKHGHTVYKTKVPALLDSQLKTVALTTFFYALLSLTSVLCFA